MMIEWGLSSESSQGVWIKEFRQTFDTRQEARDYRNNYLANFDRLYTSKAKGGHGWKLKVGRVEVTHRWLG